MEVCLHHLLYDFAVYGTGNLGGQIAGNRQQGRCSTGNERRKNENRTDICLNVERYPELVKREYEEGHIVGNHTYNHVEITRIDSVKAKEEIEKTSQAVERITGRPTEYMRPPFGAWQKDLEKEMNVIPVL